jgi:hypothetical protein
MKTLAKVFITVSVISFATALTGPGSEFLWGLLKPLSALLFVAFFITNLLADEYAQYDEERQLRLELAQNEGGARPSKDEGTQPVGRPRFAH